MWGVEWWWMDSPDFRPWILEFQGLTSLDFTGSFRPWKVNFRAWDSAIPSTTNPCPTFCPQFYSSRPVFTWNGYETIKLRQVIIREPLDQFAAYLFGFLTTENQHLQIYARRSDTRTRLCHNPQEVIFEDPMKRHSWKDSISLVSLKDLRRGESKSNLLHVFESIFWGPFPLKLGKNHKFGQNVDYKLV